MQGSVAKSTHSGIPWLRRIRRELGGQIHFWPFDGWTPPPGRSVIAEIYPALWSRTWPAGDRDSHQHDAWSSARWMRERDADGTLVDWWNPRLSETEAVIAGVEGWILGLA